MDESLNVGPFIKIVVHKVHKVSIYIVTLHDQDVSHLLKKSWNIILAQNLLNNVGKRRGA